MLDKKLYDPAAVGRAEKNVRTELASNPGIRSRAAAADFHKKVLAQLIADDVLLSVDPPQAWLEEYRYLRDLTEDLYGQAAESLARIDGR